MNIEEKIIILDFGGSYTQLLARKVRELQVYCEIMPFNISYEELLAAEPDALILSGGLSNANELETFCCDPRLYRMGRPILGIGYGAGRLIADLGGAVQSRPGAEYLPMNVLIRADDALLSGVAQEFTAWMNPGYQISAVPPGFSVIAENADGLAAAIADPTRKFYGLQFHPEAAPTPPGGRILENFLKRICAFSGTWTVKNYIDSTMSKIEKLLGPREKVVCGLSGGVDSSVAAALIHRVVGDRLFCIFVDHGLLRKGEQETVRDIFDRKLNMNVVYVDAGAEFLALLRGVTDPEEKRKIIGNHFIRVFEREAGKLGDISYLVQGTLYTDVIESGAVVSAMIKSHHNVGGLPEDMHLKLIEPLRYLFKDEVRQAGLELGLPEELIWRHPFPGPGLAIRILGEVTREKVAILQEAEAIILEEIRSAGLYREIWQAFAVLPDILSVGVKEGRRTYAHTIILRAVTSRDGLTADCYPMPYDLLGRMAERLADEIPQVSRLVYDISSKPPATIEFE